MNAREFIRLRVEAFGRTFLPSVRQLAVPDDYGHTLLPAGSATLLWHRGHRYLITAAHVAELYPDRNLLLGTASAWIEVPHPFRLMKKRDTSGDDDTIDIAFKRLQPDLADQFDGCHFLTADQIATTDRPVFTPPHRSKYTALGWPLNRFSYSRAARTTTPKNLAHTGAIASPAEYARVRLPIETHVAIEFDKKQVIGPEGVHSAPAITGLSGGGIFRMPALEQPGNLTPPTLAAITTHHRPVERLIVGSRIGPILRSIDTDPENPDVAT